MSRDDSTALAWIAAAMGARAARRRERIQSLWGGMGELYRVELDGAAVRTAIVKWARPPVAHAGARASGAAEASSRRKRRSFDVEAAFYREVAPRCDDTCRVPNLVASRGSDVEGEWWLVLEDLDAAGFARRIDEANGAALDAALRWLASFHARFCGESFPSLWPVGNYWNLATRQDELAAVRDPAVRRAAPEHAARLANARYQTLVHGDPKEANFCFDATGTHVAAVDFQYVGRGCGMTDVAYLLHGRSDAPADGIDAPRLDTYFTALRAALAIRGDAAPLDGADLEREWRALYPVARADFHRFLAGWRPG